MKETIILRIPSDKKSNLKNIAKEKGYSLNTLIMFLINSFLEENS